MELRKNKRDETLNKRRNVPITGDDVDEVDEAGDKPQLSDIVVNASSQDPAVQLAAVQSARWVQMLYAGSLYFIIVTAVQRLVQAPDIVVGVRQLVAQHFLCSYKARFGLC